MAVKSVRNSRAAPYAGYIMQALKVLKPPENLTVSEWADKFRVLSPKDSAAPGPWHTSRTPYLKEPMDSFNNPHVQDITFVAGTQLGKTVMEQNMIAYAIDQEPGPMLIVYPTDKLAEFTSANRLQPMIALSEPLRSKFNAERSQKLELQFTDMYIALVGANTPSGLSSRPVQYVFFDEIDKFPKWTGNEAGPLELAEERTKTFYNKKIVKVSSPTLKSGNIWQGWEQAEAQYQYMVPCPVCGEMQSLKMKNLHWPEGAAPAEAKAAAEYRCEACGHVIDDRQKMGMLRDGHWECIRKSADRPRKIAYHLNSFYSPWLTFGDIAYKFLSAKDRPEKLMNFINSWLAEPWVSKADRMRSDVVMERPLPYERGILNKKVRRLALKSVLSANAAEGNIIVVDAIAMDSIKTKAFRGFLDAVKCDGKAVVITPEVNENVVKSARNIPGVLTTTAKILSVYDILNAKYLVIDQAALATIEEVYA